MEKETLINYIANNLNNGTDEYEIERYLKIKNVDPSEFESMFAIAKERILEGKLSTYPKKNKMSFIVWTTLTLLTFILFLFVLPKQNITGGTTILSIIGGICICFFAFNAFLYYKSWTEDFIKKIGQPKLDLQIFIALAIIPTVILAFIIGWRFESEANQILKETQEDAVATVIDGKSIEGRRLNFADITVKFTTKEGHEVIATEDVSTYQFKDFYIGQEINIVYSKANPLNIDLLIDEDSVKELKSTQERDIAPNDLINLVNADNNAITNTLNKISFGWIYEPTKSFWINEKRRTMILKNKDVLTFISDKMDQNYTFPREFIKMGFKKVGNNIPQERDPLGAGPKTFENDKFVVNIKTIVIENKVNSVVTIQKK